MSSEKQLPLVTFEQAKRLDKVGVCWNTHILFCFGNSEGWPDGYPITINEWRYKQHVKVIGCPYVAHALKFMRDIIGIKCGVTQSDRKYVGWYENRDYLIVWTRMYDTFDEADSANLDAILDELEEEKKR